MRKRTIKSERNYIKLFPVLGTFPRLRFEMYQWTTSRSLEIALSHDQVEKLRDALTDWLESGAK